MGVSRLQPSSVLFEGGLDIPMGDVGISVDKTEMSILHGPLSTTSEQPATLTPLRRAGMHHGKTRDARDARRHGRCIH